MTQAINAEKSDTQRRIDSPRGSSQSAMRAYNERLVLTLVRQKGPLPKAEVARLTGLSAQSVSVIIGALESDGLLAKGKPIRGKVGQPSVPMGLVAEGAYFLGLKIDRRSLDMTLIDFLGQVVGNVRMTHQYPRPDSAVAFATDAIDSLLERLEPEQRKRIAGLGIALPFQLWDWASVLGVSPDDMEEWRDRNVAAELAERCDFPVYLCNDATAACGAELVFGTSPKPKDFLYFYVGFFAGGGIVLDGTLYAGSSGNAGALGSLPVAGNNGKMQQLVDVASLATLETMLEQNNEASRFIWEEPESWAVNPAILDEWVENASIGLAQAIGASACLIDFDEAIIDGWIPAEVRRALVEKTRAYLELHRPAGIVAPQILEGTLGGNAQSLGAVCLPLSNRFLVDRNEIAKV